MSKCKPKTRFIPALCAWSLLIGATALFFVFPCRYLTLSYQIAIPVWQGIITIFVVANFTLATFMDPGIIPKASKEEIKDDDFRVPLYKNVEINGIAVRMKWCTTCRFYRPPRCSHCSVCNICIETFDHHCPWVNNCIGRRNYRHFFMFLVSLSIHMMTIFAFCLVFLLDHTDQLDRPDTIVCIAIMVIIFCLIFPILGLTGFHMVLVSRGRTTNEQVTGKFRGGYNPFSRGCCKNMGYTLCGPLYPRYTGRKSRLSSTCANSPPISTIPMESQVRVYMDASNGVRVSNLNAYNKMSQGANVSDTDLALDAIDAGQSQSRDCEPTPPTCPRTNGSKTNLFDTAEFREAIAAGNHVARGGNANHHHHHHTRGDASPKSGRTSVGANSASANVHRPRGTGGTPPDVAGSSPRDSRGNSPGSARSPLTSPVRRSNPGTPTTPSSPGAKRRVGGVPYYQELRQRQQQLAAAAAAHPHHTAHSYMTAANASEAAAAPQPRSISPQRRLASESDLTRPAEHHSGSLYMRGSHNHTADNLYDGSPSRGSSSNSNNGGWRGEQHYANVEPLAHYGRAVSPNWSHPTSPTSGAVTGRPPPSAYATRRSSGSTSPLPKRKVYGIQGAVGPPMHWGPSRDGGAGVVGPGAAVGVPWAGGAARRPMSFVKALEVSDSMEMSVGGGVVGTPKTEHRLGLQPQQQQTFGGGGGGSATDQDADRSSFYDTNYEISV